MVEHWILGLVVCILVAACPYQHPITYRHATYACEYPDQHSRDSHQYTGTGQYAGSDHAYKCSRSGEIPLPKGLANSFA